MKEQRSLRGKYWHLQHQNLTGEALKKAVTAARQQGSDDKVWHQPSFKDLLDPSVLKDLDAAKTRIEQAIETGERIMVYGDFDCDGITATAALVHGLKSLGAEVSYRIPERVRDSHGFKKTLIDEIIKTDTKLLITVDCGVNDREEVAYAVAHGLEVIITDHHAVDPRRRVEKAVAVINPNQSECAYATKNLAGVGVVFKLLQALRPDETWLEPYLALTAVGTVADCIALTGESRTLVQLGLKALNQNYWPGLQALLDTDDDITEETIGFQLAPCLNAASRLGEVQHAVQLFLGNPNQTSDRVVYLQHLNQERRELTKTFTAQAQTMVALDKAAQILFLEDCPVGILGLVASRISEETGQSVFCIKRHESGVLHGSARGFAGGNITAALGSVSALLTTFGGHKGAAGFRLNEADLADFMNGIWDWYTSHPPEPASLEVTALTEPKGLNKLWYKWQQTLSPFGMGNAQMVWQLSGLTLTDCQIIGRDQLHARLTLKGGHEVLAFFVTDIIDSLKVGETYDWAITLHQNTWQGQSRLQWQLVDVRENKI